MKTLILIFSTLISTISFAQSIGGTDGGGAISFQRGGNAGGTTTYFEHRRSSGGNMGGGKLVFNESDVEAIVTKDEIYIRPADLQDGIERVDGVEVYQNIIQIDPKKPSFNLDRVLMNNGKVMRAVSGGTNGGGT